MLAVCYNYRDEAEVPASSLTSLQHLLPGNRVSSLLQWVGLFFGLNEEGLSGGVGSACVDAEHKARHNGPYENVQLGWVLLVQ